MTFQLVTHQVDLVVPLGIPPGVDLSEFHTQRGISCSKRLSRNCVDQLGTHKQRASEQAVLACP